MQTESQRLRHRPDKVDRFLADISEHRACAENKHDRDNRRRNQDGAANVARGRACFASENRDVFESAERAGREFAKNVEAIKDRHRGKRELEWVVRFQFAARETEERQQDESTVNKEHRKSTEVVEPFA